MYFLHFQEEDRQREEAEKKAEEERKRREQEEYEAMKAAFSVDSEGYEENELEDQESLLKQFIDYIKVRTGCNPTTLHKACEDRSYDQKRRVTLVTADNDAQWVVTRA